MRRAVLFGALFVMVVVGAAALRLARLDNRPMHCDEANQALKFGDVLKLGYYDYDPEEHHGPSLSLLTLPIARLASAENLSELTEIHLRLVPAILGTVLIGLVWLLRDELGYAAALWASLLTALSPAMVFYSRYYVQEMLLVCFTFGAIVALWRYARYLAPRLNGGPRGADRLWGRRAFWLVLLGLSVGMMHASKETCIIALSAMAVAAAVAMADLRQAGWKPIVLSCLIVLITAGGSSALLFSTFLASRNEVVESYTAYSHYFARAAGEGTAGLHDYPWYRYFQWLFWWRHNDGPVWTEAPIAALALVGSAASVWGKGLTPRGRSMARFLGIYTALMTLVYCAIPYKTPWCALGLLHGMILTAGIGATVLVRVMPHWTLKAAAVLLILAAAGHLARQAWKASFVAFEDPDNPYVYAQTTSDVLDLTQRVREFAAVHPSGKDMSVQVICPDHDYWPLPWYFRDFTRVGLHDRMPDGPPARLIIIQAKLEPALIDHLYVKQPPGQRHLYVPVPREPEGRDWQLRPNVPLRMYVRLDLWETYLAGRPARIPPGKDGADRTPRP